MENIITTSNTIHFVDHVKIEVYPMEGSKNQTVKISCYAKGDHREGHVENIIINHEFIQMKAEAKKNYTKILIGKKEGE